MRSLFLAVIPASILAIAVACTDTSSQIDPVGAQPQISSASGPAGGAVQCADPIDASASDGGIGGGNCPITIQIAFRLPEGAFVDEALVRFQGDGSDTGIDREYTLPLTYGRGDNEDVIVSVNAEVPANILVRGTLYTYEVRLVTGTGAQSLPTTLTVSVT